VADPHGSLSRRPRPRGRGDDTRTASAPTALVVQISVRFGKRVFQFLELLCGGWIHLAPRIGQLARDRPQDHGAYVLAIGAKFAYQGSQGGQRLIDGQVHAPGAGVSLAACAHSGPSVDTSIRNVSTLSTATSSAPSMWTWSPSVPPYSPATSVPSSSLTRILVPGLSWSSEARISVVSIATA
jgi:hypothetical protein